MEKRSADLKRKWLNQNQNVGDNEWLQPQYIAPTRNLNVFTRR